MDVHIGHFLTFMSVEKGASLDNIHSVTVAAMGYILARRPHPLVDSYDWHKSTEPF